VKQDVNNRIGVFLCSGCSIGDRLNIDSLRDISSIEEQVVLSEVHPFLCHADCRKEISDAIAEHKLDKVVIGACSPRVKRKELFFDSIHTERVNLREQVAWCHSSGDEDTQMLAEDCMRMGIARARTTGIPDPEIKPELTTDILIVGGGITGMSAAIESAKAGYHVFLVEREETLGGQAALLYKQIPAQSPYGQLAKPIVHQIIDETESEQGIEILRSTTVKSISGQPGEFNILLSGKGTKKQIKAASIIMATGWKPYDANRLTEYAYGKNPNVITNHELEKMVDGSTILRPSDKKPVQRALFIQCAGSRDKNHLPYCSTYCCGTSLKQAKYFREMNPDSQVFIIYRDIRAFGTIEFFYKEVQKDEGIFMTKGVVSGVLGSENELVVEVKESLIDDLFRVNVDLVVLATGMVPNDAEDLNLTYRLGKGLPGLKYDFPDSHFICFPYETRRTGIYAAGNLRTPGFIPMCMEDAAGAAMKAIQCAELTREGKSVHPRTGDRSYPELFMQRCTDCKRCTEECPFGSYDETEKGTPLSNPNRCRRCGICVGSCPERIISFQDFSIHSVSSMIKAIEVPDELEEKPRVLAFVCENDAYPAFDMAGIQRLEYSTFLRIIPVRCIGSVNPVWISDALSNGFDGILLIGCKPGENYQCHYIQGSELMETRGENIRETLQTMMLEPERIRTEFLEINEYYRIPDIVNGFLEEIETMGPNPFKGL